MKKEILTLAVAAAMVLSCTACGETSMSFIEEISGNAGYAERNDKGYDDNDNNHAGDTEIKPSPDKYTWYVKDYVGKNIYSFGYTSLGGDRRDHYGASQLLLIFMTEDGTYIDIEDEEQLKQYYVAAQNLEPNTELKYIFETDKNGKEYDNLVASQNFEEIVLLVKKTNDKSKVSKNLTKIKASPDKYTWYVKDYVGMNVASFGYTSLGGDRRDRYGESQLKLVFIADDGAYIDVEDEEQLKQYVVIRQGIAPNAEIKYTFLTGSDGKEYDNLVASQSYEEIDLYVKNLKE